MIAAKCGGLSVTDTDCVFAVKHEMEVSGTKKSVEKHCLNV